MNLKEQFKEEFNIDFPIKGGDGLSIENPIIIEKTEMNDYAEVEYVYLKYYAIYKNIIWHQVEQNILNHKDRKIDRFKMHIPLEDKAEFITFYFDITECFSC